MLTPEKARKIIAAAFLTFVICEKDPKDIDVEDVQKVFKKYEYLL